MVAAMMITCSFILIVGLSAGLTSQGAPNGGPGTGDFDDDDGGDDGGDSAPLDKSTVQFIVLGVSAGVLLILQGVSRANRSGTLPLLVEVIAFFSMLDLITDVTYLTTEEWANETLQLLATLFVITPFVAISGFFMFKTYRFNAEDDGEGLMIFFQFVMRILGLEAIAVILVVPPTICLLAVLGSIAEPGIEILGDTFQRLQHWGKKKSKQSIVFLVATLIGFILLAVAALLGLVIAVAAFAVAWPVVLGGVLLAPVMYSLMVIVRSFAIFPGIWEAFEDLFAGLGMKDEAREAVFHQNGGDQSNPEQDMYYMLSTTLLYEFVLETMPQIAIQSVNNNLLDGWEGFAIASIAISAFVAVDALYRQFVMVCLLGVTFGSAEVFNPDV